MGSIRAKSKLIQNTVSVFLSQGGVYLANLLIGFLLPGLLGVEQYGYWQTYLLYAGYVGVFQFGFNDGVYIRFGSYDYDALPRPFLRTSLRVMVASQAIIMAIFLIAFSAFIKAPDTRVALSFVAIDLIIMALNTFFLMVFQITNRFEKYGILRVIPRFTLAASVLVCLLSGYSNYKIVILADIFAKTATLMISVWFGRDLVFGICEPLRTAFSEIISTMRTGIVVTVINVLNTILLSFGRMVIERGGPIEEFSSFSFGTTLVNALLLFITALGSVIYPLFCRAGDKLREYFDDAIILVSSSSLVLLGFYPLVIWGVRSFFSQYIGLLGYFHILLPLIVAQAKVTIVTRNLFNAKGWLKQFLYINLAFSFVMCLASIWAYRIWGSAESIAWVTLVILLGRSYATEIYSRAKMEKKHWHEIGWELVVLILFLIGVELHELWIFYVALAGYLAFHKKRLAGFARRVYFANRKAGS